MSLIAMEFERNENALKGRLRHWFRFDHLRPEQGIALLIGLEADDVYVQAVLDWGKSKNEDYAILDFGVSLLNGDEIKTSLGPKSDNERKPYDERIHPYECHPFIETESNNEMTEEELELSSASVEAEVAAITAATVKAMQEAYDNFYADLEGIRNHFSDFVNKHRAWCQYWGSGDHPRRTPLTYFVEWATSKGFNPYWEAVAVELGQIPGEASVNDGKQPESQSITDLERDRLLKQIGALALTLAEKSNQYKRSNGKPNALEIAKNTVLILDALPDANSRGVGESNIRESIKVGLELLTAIKG